MYERWQAKPAYSRRVSLIRRVWMNSSSCRQSGWILLQVPQWWIIVAVLLDICWAIATLADKGPEQALMTSCRISCRRNAVLTYCWTRRQCLRFGRRRRGCISAVGCVSRRRPIRVISVISRRVAIIIRRTCCHRCGGSNHGSSAEQLPTHAISMSLRVSAKQTHSVQCAFGPGASATLIARACLAEITFSVCESRAPLRRQSTIPAPGAHAFNRR